MAARPLPDHPHSPPTSPPRAKALPLGARASTSQEALGLSGEVVGRALGVARLSHEQAAQAAGCSRSTIRGWTEGDRVSLARLLELGMQRRSLLVALGQELVALGEAGTGAGLPMERHGLRVAKHAGAVARAIEEATRTPAASQIGAAAVVRELEDAARAIEAARRDILPLARAK